MSLENLMKLYKLIGGTIGDYYRGPNRIPGYLQIAGRGNRVDSGIEAEELKDTEYSLNESFIMSSLRDAPEYEGIGEDDLNGIKCEDINYICEKTGLTVKDAEVALQRLLDKGVIKTGEFPNGMVAYYIS